MEERTEEQIKVDAFWETVEKKVETLSAALGRKVYSIVLLDTENKGEFVVGYAYEPDLTTQFRLIDKASALGADISIEACAAALDSLIIASESDPKITDKKNQNYWKAAAYTLSNYMTMAIPVIKKK